MTLLDLATYICTTINQQEAVDLAACKAYLSQRHKMLWQAALWKNSLVEYEQTITSQGYDPTTSVWLPTRQILLVHPIFAQVVAVRTRDWRMRVQSSEWFYCKDIDDFQNKGVAVNYRLLPPAVWDFDTATSVGVWGASLSDSGSTTIVKTLEADGLTEDTASKSITTNGQALGSVLTIESVSKGATQGSVSVGQFVPTPFSFTVTYKGGAFPLHVAINSTNLGDAVAGYGTGGGTLIIPANIGDTLHFWLDTNLSPNTYTVSAGGDLLVDSSVAFLFTPFPDNSQTPIITLSNSEITAKKRERIQLIGSLSDNTILRLLGKRTAPDFISDADEPAIPGSENVLICAAHIDMLKRERQYAKAATMTQAEFGPLLTALIAEQTAQQAFRKRFVPTDGFGDVNAFIGPDGNSPLTF